MNAPKILFPTDFSAMGHAALEMATSLARDRGATLLIAHVLDMPMEYGPSEMWYSLSVVDKDHLKTLLEQVVPPDPSVPCEHRLVEGHPATEIVRLAEEENVDLIVMATHGWSGVKRLLMGSVAEKVVRKAKCPVLTLKNAVHAPVPKYQEEIHA